MTLEWLIKAAATIGLLGASAAHAASPIPEPQSCQLTPLSLTPSDQNAALHLQRAVLALESEPGKIWLAPIVPIASPNSSFNKVEYWPAFVALLSAAIKKGDRITMSPCPMDVPDKPIDSNASYFPRADVIFGKIEMYGFRFYSCIDHYTSHFQKYCKKP